MYTLVLPKDDECFSMTNDVFQTVYVLLMAMNDSLDYISISEVINQHVLQPDLAFFDVSPCPDFMLYDSLPPSDTVSLSLEECPLYFLLSQLFTQILSWVGLHSHNHQCLLEC